MILQEWGREGVCHVEAYKKFKALIVITEHFVHTDEIIHRLIIQPKIVLLTESCSNILGIMSQLEIHNDYYTESNTRETINV